MENLNSQTAFALIRLHCPNCQRLYSVEAAQIVVAEPRFECTSCFRQFAFRFPLPPGEAFGQSFLLQDPEFAPETKIAAVLNLPEEKHQAAVLAPVVERVQEARRPATPAPIIENVDTCPKCRARRAPDANECQNCGVLFKKIRLEEKFSGEIKLNGRPELNALWRDVLENFSAENLHERFIFACHDAECLPFASQKYGRILQANPSDETAKKMRRKIVALASIRAQISSVPAPKAFPFPKLTSLAIFLSAAILFVGIFVPPLRNLAGLGAAMLGLSLGIRFYLR